MRRTTGSGVDRRRPGDGFLPQRRAPPVLGSIGAVLVTGSCPGTGGNAAQAGGRLTPMLAVSPLDAPMDPSDALDRVAHLIERGLGSSRKAAAFASGR